MKIYTSYFSSKKVKAIAKQNPHLLYSVALKRPEWLPCKSLDLFFPTSKLLKDYKEGLISEEEYNTIYKRDILDHVERLDLYNQLKEGIVLLCWCKPNAFCHRHLISRFLKESYSIEIKEL